MGLNNNKPDREDLKHDAIKHCVSISFIVTRLRKRPINDDEYRFVKEKLLNIEKIIGKL